MNKFHQNSRQEALQSIYFKVFTTKNDIKPFGVFGIKLTVLVLLLRLSPVPSIQT